MVIEYLLLTKKTGPYHSEVSKLGFQMDLQFFQECSDPCVGFFILLQQRNQPYHSEDKSQMDWFFATGFIEFIKWLLSFFYWQRKPDRIMSEVFKSQICDWFAVGQWGSDPCFGFFGLLQQRKPTVSFWGQVPDWIGFLVWEVLNLLYGLVFINKLNLGPTVFGFWGH